MFRRGTPIDPAGSSKPTTSQQLRRQGRCHPLDHAQLPRRQPRRLLTYTNIDFWNSLGGPGSLSNAETAKSAKG
jgi:hypothetical protein